MIVLDANILKGIAWTSNGCPSLPQANSRDSVRGASRARPDRTPGRGVALVWGFLSVIVRLALEQLQNCRQATTFRVWKIRIHTEKDFGRGIRPVGRPHPVRSPRIMVGLGAFFHVLR